MLTGFKYIGEQIHFLEEEGHPERFIFGFEESYGYLVGTHARDKDAVVGSMMICEMAAYLKSKGVTVLDFLESIYHEYGYYHHVQQSFRLRRRRRHEADMNEIMDDLQANPPVEIAGRKVEQIDNYITHESKNLATGEVTKINLPKIQGTGLSFGRRRKGHHSSFPARNPKIKAYYTTIANNKADAAAQQKELAADFSKKLGF